ncbi:cell wall integrity and stress response component 2 [Drosophila santomea]|uniref:cell wall integrity and stress response component 2 n=1 Tax=Drosophila santomea TaxID=129105 RepID=UPI0019530215|nr:cell wall integrity and stress response component 2 [Drosophila santomea]
MQSHLIAILLATVAIGSCVANPNLISGPSQMLETMRATSEMQRNNPQLAGQCFDYYYPLLENIYGVYQKEYNQCIAVFDGGKAEVNQRYVPVVWGISNTTFVSCMKLLDCDYQNSSQNALSCYAEQGPIRTMELSSVAFNASTQVSSLLQAVEQLEFTRDLCCNTSSRNYEIRFTESNQNLQKCLLGLSPVPESSTTSTTSTTSTITTTTAAPVSTVSTDSPTTIAETTSAPIISSSTTRAPSTVSHFSAVENSSGSSQNRFARRVESILKHIV